METSYSYTTVVVEPDGKARISVSMHPDERMWMECPRDRGRAQITLSHARAEVTITPTNAEEPTAEDVETARKLAELFGRYAAEVERLHALNSASAPGESAA